MKRLIVISGFLILNLTMAFSQEPLTQVIRIQGAPALCNRDDSPRIGSRENPDVHVQLSNRDVVQALHLKLVQNNWSLSESGDKVFRIVAQIQLVSCIEDNSGNRRWFFEQPDKTDWAEAMIPTGLFSGEILSSDFKRVVFLNDESEEKVFYSDFAIPADKLFSKKQLKNYLSGREAHSTVVLSYHFKNLNSKVRPSFSYSMVSGQFPGEFELDLTFKEGKLQMINQKSK